MTSVIEGPFFLISENGTEGKTKKYVLPSVNMREKKLLDVIEGLHHEYLKFCEMENEERKLEIESYFYISAALGKYTINDDDDDDVPNKSECAKAFGKWCEYEVSSFIKINEMYGGLFKAIYLINHSIV